MHDFSILQVGDLHFDELLGAGEEVDAKDPGFPGGLREAISARPLQGVMKAMSKQLDHADAMMVVGDLSSYGDLPVYQDAVTYLDRALALPERDVEGVHAVVGNHDVDRELITPGPRNLSQILSKFKPLQDTWLDRSIPVLAPSDVRTTEVVKGAIGLTLFSLNSCIGCGEYRDSITDPTLQGELESKMAAGDVHARDILFEQLDSPAFLEDHLADTTAAIRALSPHRVPVLLAHHNVLPQFQPRLQIYTEMVNSGNARSRFAACDRTVLYLHGHIHDDPVEVIEQLRPHSGKLISISAPRVQDGFNMLRVTFGQRELPIGLTVEPWRYRYGEVHAEQSVRISLRRKEQENHEATETILSVLAEKPAMRYSQFLTAYRERHGAAFADPDLQQGLLEAEWSGLLQVDNHADPPDQWILRLSLL